MREVLGHVDGAAAVLFDVDGTMYRNGPVRRTMLLRLARAHTLKPASGVRTMKALSAYRKAQETLRGSGFTGDVAFAQLDMAADRSGVDRAVVAAAVERWMEISPLDVVAASARPGLAEVLDELRRSGVRLGALSDYPAAGKLAALGIADYFDIVLTAQDPRVHAFKPDPKGLLVALDELGVAPADALYVGDRDEVDGAAARAAGMRYVIVGGSSGEGHASRRGPPAPQRAEAT